MKSISVSGKNWISKKFEIIDIEYLKKDFFLDEITAKLLAIRKIEKKDIKTFLEPSIKNILPNPFVLKDMEISVKRITDSIKNKEKIGIFGDYDVDGATSTAILGQYLKLLNHPFEIYIPDRKSEGYGPTISSFEKLIDKGVKIIFTVDCGTLSFDPIKFLKKKKD